MIEIDWREVFKFEEQAQVEERHTQTARDIVWAWHRRYIIAPYSPPDLIPEIAQALADFEARGREDMRKEQRDG